MKSTALLRAVASSALVSSTWALGTADWKKQSIYQVITDRFALTNGSTDACDDLRSYCGGTFQGIINNLDYIQDMGFTAIWISPMVKNLEDYTAYGNAYHGYWAQDIWSVNEHFGTADDLSSLSDALHDRNMYLMLDVVTNHMGYNGCGDCVDYSIFDQFNEESYFHSYCAIDYDDTTSVQQCWEGDDTVSLPDLRTEDDDVRSVWNDWIGQVVSNYSIDGLRIDSCLEVEQEFFPGFGEAAGVYSVCEAFTGDPSAIATWDDYVSGVMNYPAYYWITDFFQSDSAAVGDLVDGINTLKGEANTTSYGSFLENHDNPRFPSLTSDEGQISSAIVFAMMNDGIPIVYQGQEQGFSGASDPDNREALWPSGYDTSSTYYELIASANAVRNAAVATDGTSYTDYQAVPVQINDYALAMIKDNVVSAFSNMGSGGTAYTVNVTSDSLAYDAGTVLVEAISCGDTVTVASAGSFSFEMTATPKVFYPQGKLSGTGVCGE